MSERPWEHFEPMKAAQKNIENILSENSLVFGFRNGPRKHQLLKEVKNIINQTSEMIMAYDEINWSADMIKLSKLLWKKILFYVEFDHSQSNRYTIKNKFTKIIEETVQSKKGISTLNLIPIQAPVGIAYMALLEISNDISKIENEIQSKLTERAKAVEKLKVSYLKIQDMFVVIENVSNKISNEKFVAALKNQNKQTINYDELEIVERSPSINSPTKFVNIVCKISLTDYLEFLVYPNVFIGYQRLFVDTDLLKHSSRYDNLHSQEILDLFPECPPQNEQVSNEDLVSAHDAENKNH